MLTRLSVLFFLVGIGAGFLAPISPSVDAACNATYLVEETNWQLRSETTPTERCDGVVPCGFTRYEYRWSECWGPGLETDHCVKLGTWNDERSEVWICDDEYCILDIAFEFPGDRFHSPFC